MPKTRRLLHLNLARAGGAALLLLVLSTRAPAAQPAPASPPAPAIITMQQTDLRPEGLAYDPISRRFFVSSTARGTVYAVNEDGTSAPFVQDDAFQATFGLEVDEARGRLLVASTDLSVLGNREASGRAGLGAYDLKTGARLFYTDLTTLSPNGRPLGNDLALDPAGNVYVSDSLAPVIYKVDVQGKASVLVNDARLAPARVEWLDVNFGVGGIAYQDGFLLAAHDATLKLYKIPLAAPQRMSEVAVDVPFYADGLIFNGQRQLLAVADGGKVALYESADGWRSAHETVAVTGYDPATSVTLRGSDAYVLYAYIGQEAPRERYEIVRVNFDKRR